MHTDLGNIPFFFILGRPRSGTTLLRTLFDAHPGVIIPWECQYIINLYPRYGKTTLWTKLDLEDFYEDLLKQWQFKLWTVDLKKLKQDILNLEGKNSYAMVCRTVHASFRSLYDKKEPRFIGDKNPGYSIYISRLKKIFPEAKFIYILRDYRDTFLSIKNVDFELPVVSIVTYKWKYFFKQSLKAKKAYPESVYILKYEDLVSEPELHFRLICKFLGLEYTPEVFDFYEKRDEAHKVLKTERAKRNHASLLNPISTRRVGLWKKGLSEEEVRIADHVAGRFAKKAGYRRKYKSAGIKTVILSFPGTVYARMLYFLTRIINRFPYRLRAVILNKGPLLIARTFRKLKK